MNRRSGIALVVVFASVALLAAVAGDAARRAAPPSAGTLALVEASGLFDLFRSSSSRWLRHPSITERAAALADAPDGLDVDPGGLAIRPPPEPELARLRRAGGEP